MFFIVTTETIDGKKHETKGLVRIVGSVNQMNQTLTALKEQAIEFGGDAIVALKTSFVNNNVVFLGTAVKLKE